MVTLRIKPNIMDKASQSVSVGYEYGYWTSLFLELRIEELMKFYFREAALD
jgi:hypothetical protein